MASKSSYDAFASVDKLVAKPVLGSDGAASWQEFRKEGGKGTGGGNVAPSIPLKKMDRLAGTKSLVDERAHENQIRKEAGEAEVGSGYTVFKKKNQAEEAAARKKRKRIEDRIRPDDKKYFIAAETFEGFKFDYIFTTRDRGTGYYWDGMDSLKKLHSGDDAPEEEEEPETVPQEKPKKKRKKKKAKAAPPVIVNDPNNPMEQVAQAIERRNAALRTPLILPSGWEKATDPTSQKTYYFCRATGQRQWEPPTGDSLPPGWSAVKDTATGKEYYFHKTTGETRWDRPT